MTLLYLGRVHLRVGRVQEALARFTEAKTLFEQIGAADEVPPVDARIAECRVYEGAYDEALQSVSDMLHRAKASKTIAKLLPLLKRIEALSLLGKESISPRAQPPKKACVKVAPKQWSSRCC